MHQRPDPSSDDRARLQHYLEYLEWRGQQLNAERAARRQWWLREALIVVGLVVGGTLFTALLFVGHRDLRRAGPAVTSQPDLATAVLPSTTLHGTARDSATTGESVASPTRDAVTPAIERKAAAQPRPAARVSRTARVNPSSQRRATSPDVDSRAPASAAIESASPSSSISTALDGGPAPSPSAPPSSTEVVAVVPAPARTEVVAVVPGASSTEVVAVAPNDAVPSTTSSGATATAAPGDCADMAAVMRGDPSSDGRTHKQRVVDCVGGWLKGQSQEFRDGMKREFGEFRGGVDTVGRGLQWLGSKLRRPE
jgi:hypothetical protein